MWSLCPRRVSKCANGIGAEVRMCGRTRRQQSPPRRFDIGKFACLGADSSVQRSDNRSDAEVRKAGECRAGRLEIRVFGFSDILLCFDSSEQGFGLILLRSFRLPAHSRKINTKALQIRQPSAGKRALTPCKILSEGIDDVRDGLIVGRSRDNHGRLATCESSLCPFGGNDRKQCGRLASSRRAIHG
jgi:hypothetical protein